VLEYYAFIQSVVLDRALYLFMLMEALLLNLVCKMWHQSRRSPCLLLIYGYGRTLEWFNVRRYR